MRAIVHIAPMAGLILSLAGCGGGADTAGYSAAGKTAGGVAAAGSESTATPAAGTGPTTASTGVTGIANNGAALMTVATSNAGSLAAVSAGADGWTQCAVENEVCTVPGRVQVRYGVEGKYAYAVVAGSIGCNTAAFTDPAYGSFKACAYAPLANGGADGVIHVRSSSGRTLAVGPGREFKKPCAALTAAADGDVVEIDAAGSYVGDVCAFGANELTIRGVGGRPKIDAGGQYAWGKGTWVVLGRGTVIENVEMVGAKVPDQNGAAIRLDGQHLTVRTSFIHDNENGILTNDHPLSTILIENTEFGYNGYGTGATHNVYVGRVASLIFRFNFSHDANVGHNLKSRALVSTVSYNRFSSTRPGESGSTAAGEPSYEIDLPNAGTAYLIGNVIEQPARNQNSNLVAYGMEGASNAGQSLYAVNNTFINDGDTGTFLLIGGDVKNRAFILNNVFSGSGAVTGQGSAILRNNVQARAAEFRNQAAYDLRPAADAPFIAAGAPGGYSDTGVRLAPLFEYLHLAAGKARVDTAAMDAGAYAAP